MPEPFQAWALTQEVILAAHLLVPLTLGALALVARAQRKRRAAVAREDDKQPGESTAVQAVRCAKCGAPVPLDARVLPCPSCDAPVAPPPGYAKTLIRRTRAHNELRRAERMWQRSRWICAERSIVVWKVLVIAWALLPLATLSAQVAFLPAELVGVAWLTAAVGGVFNLTLVLELDKERAILPPPGAGLMRLVAGAAVCGRCKAPVRFEAGTFSALCGYCGSDEYRSELAREASTDALEVKGSARRSLLEAYRAVADRRASALLTFAMIAGFELLIITGVLIGKVPYLGTILEVLGGLS